MSITYCKRCDLGFCEEHIKDHMDDHEITNPFKVELGFCAVCTGIYRPNSS